MPKFSQIKFKQLESTNNENENINRSYQQSTIIDGQVQLFLQLIRDCKTLNL